MGISTLLLRHIAHVAEEHGEAKLPSAQLIRWLVELAEGDAMRHYGYEVRCFGVDHRVRAYGYALVEDERPEVRAAAARAAGKSLGGQVIELLADEDAAVRAAAHDVLVRLNGGTDTRDRTRLVIAHAPAHHR